MIKNVIIGKEAWGIHWEENGIDSIRWVMINGKISNMKKDGIASITWIKIGDNTEWCSNINSFYNKKKATAYLKYKKTGEVEK